MLKQEVAQKEIKKYRVAKLPGVRSKAVGKLPAKVRTIGRGLIGHSDAGKPVRDWEHRRKSFMKAAEALDSLTDSQRLSVFKALFPKISQHVNGAWQLLKKLPYQTDWERKPFRAPGDEAATRARRGEWLWALSEELENYDQDVAWLAAWTPHLGTWGGPENELGILFAAAIDAGGSEAEQVLEVLRDSAAGQHEIGGMGRHVTRGLLTCSNPDAWEFMEKMLLAAQRREGLRQAILEAIDEAHPDAFRRMLKLILDENLIRFSATVRAVDVWLRLQWDSVSTGIVRSTVERVQSYLDEPEARRKALEGDDAESVYLALWSIAFEDAHAAVAPASRLLKHKNVEHRFVGFKILHELDLDAVSPAIFQTLEDEDLRLVMLGVCGPCSQSYRGQFDEPRDLKRPKDLFDRLEAVADRFPKKKQTLKPLVWPWWKLTVHRSEIAAALVENLGSRPPTRLIPYLRDMETWTRCRVARQLATGKKWDSQTREALFALVGDSSSDVRETALKGIAKCKITDEEAEGLEKLLTRKSGDLRRGVLSLMLKQPDAKALASSQRLISARQQLQRQAGLELLRQMLEADRQVDDCLQRAAEYKESCQRPSTDEKSLLDAILSEGQDVASLDDALGLCDLAARTQPKSPKKHEVKFHSPAAFACIKALDDLVHAYRETPIEVVSWTDEKEEQLLGNCRWGFPSTNTDTPLEKDLARLPLREVWTEWYEKRPKKLQDTDGLELYRAQVFFTSREQRGSKSKKAADALFGTTKLKLRYAHIVSDLVAWLLRIHPSPKVHDFALNAAETALAMVPADELTKLSRPDYGGGRDLLWRRYDSPYTEWLSCVRRWQILCPKGWTEKHDVRLWQLYRWKDEPLGIRPPTPKRAEKGKKAKDDVEIPRERPDLECLVKAYEAGAATEADVFDQLLGPRPDQDSGHAFDELRTLTARKRPKQYADCKWLWPPVDKARDRILEVELARGDTPTAATGAANCLRSVWGTDNMIRILTALGKGTLVRGYAYSGGDNKNNVMSELLRASLPAGKDTPAQFKDKAKAAGIGEQRLLDVAVYAPQWAAFVEQALAWDGLEDAVWWVHAHAKDTNWSVDTEIRETWEAAVAERTPLAGQDLVDGGVDVAWFERVYQQLKAKRWEALSNSMKYAAGGGGHKRAELFANSLLGREKKTELVTRIEKKRYQDAVRALGLLPLAEGQAREKDLLERYKVIQEFVRTCRQFGSQRQASEKRAATIGQENLARIAGYADPIRLQWAMEAHAVSDLADGPLTVNVDDVTVSLAVDDTGQVDLTIDRGGKPLKTVPAKLRKDKRIMAIRERKTELKRQVSRIRPSLEQMMCRGATFRGGELGELMSHPLISPMLSRTVLIGPSAIGYPIRDGKALEDCSGKATGVKESDELRIAHPHDLFDTKRWHEWQKDCFQRERVQPFKQVFRELYPLTKAEIKEKTISRRYAGHQVNPRQAMALLGSRGWVSVPEEGVRRTFHEEGFSAWLEFQESYYTPAEVEGLTLEGVRFSERGQWKPINLKKIPPRLFSEVMRDLDLVVSVAHRGGVDPEASASTVEMRADLLRESLAVLNVENVEFKKDHAIVRGEYGRYSVHMGSAVTHKMPGGAMLIVPVHSQHRGRLFLPFADDDPKTAEVLSKVLLLARDSEIQDPAILDQIRILSRIVPDTVAKPQRKTKAAKAKKSVRAVQTRYFQYSDDKSNKFWEVTVDGNDVTVRYGRIGADGRKQVKSFSNNSEAQSHANKLIEQKTNKGYSEGEA